MIKSWLEENLIKKDIEEIEKLKAFKKAFIEELEITKNMTKEEKIKRWISCFREG